MDELLSERYANDLDGVLSCYDRIVITGSLLPFCYAQGMTHYLYQQGIRVFDYPQFAEPLRDHIRENAEALAAANGVKIEFIRKQDFRKENRVQQILKKRGDQPGLVHIFGAMEACSSYLPWHDKVTGKTYLKPGASKCMTYYFYFVDEQLGLCYLRVPTLRQVQHSGSRITGASCKLSTRRTWFSRTERLCKPSTRLSWIP
jgi:hypothetical protein